MLNESSPILPSYGPNNQGGKRSHLEPALRIPLTGCAGFPLPCMFASVCLFVICHSALPWSQRSFFALYQAGLQCATVPFVPSHAACDDLQHSTFPRHNLGCVLICICCCTLILNLVSGFFFLFFGIHWPTVAAVIFAWLFTGGALGYSLCLWITAPPDGEQMEPAAECH